MTFSYYPGCSLHGTSKEYDASTQAVCAFLGVELQELPNWVCCGASSGHSLNETLNIGLPAHTLKLAEQQGMDVAVPCAACYNRLKVAEHTLQGRSADAVILIAGGSGTLSEAAYAWQLGKPVIALTDSGGWAAKLAGSRLDTRHRDSILSAANPEEAVAMALQQIQ